VTGMHSKMADIDGITVSGEGLHAELQKKHISRVIFTGFFLNAHMMMSSPMNGIMMLCCQRSSWKLTYACQFQIHIMSICVNKGNEGKNAT
jgi:hypothetical protein